MRMYGLFETIGFFTICLLIIAGSERALGAMSSQQRREVWLLNAAADKTARELTSEDRQELVAGCAESVEDYCVELRNQLGLPRPVHAAVEPENEPSVEPKKRGHKKRGTVQNRKKRLEKRAQAAKKRRQMVLKARRLRPANSDGGKG